MSVTDPYKTLQVDPQAEFEVIEAAYRRLARKYHPDVSPDPESHARMIAINQAWEVLRDPVKRAAVDRERGRVAGTAAWIVAADAHARPGGPGTDRRPAAAPAQTPAGPPDAAPEPRQGWPFGMGDPVREPPPEAGGSGPRAWASGRAPLGGFASGTAGRPEGAGAAGPPPGNPSGSVLNFGRFAGWSLGEISRYEIGYLEWLDRMPIGRTYQAEIDEILRAKGRRTASGPQEQGRGGPFRRR